MLTKGIWGALRSDLTYPSPGDFQETVVRKLEWGPWKHNGHQAGGYLNHKEQENRQLLKYFQANGQSALILRPK